MADDGALNRVMAVLEKDVPFVRCGAVWRAGAVEASPALAAELVRRDLARAQGDRLVLSAAGRGWSARQKDPTAANRMLANRPLPDDAAKPANGRRVTVNLAESPLGWLRSRGLVSSRQFEAGERLRGDWTVARLGPRVTMRWDAGPRRGGARGANAPLDPTLAQIAAKRRADAAFDAVGPGLRDVLWRVVCDGEGMEQAEKALGWPARAGRVVLTLALDRLADSYGLS